MLIWVWFYFEMFNSSCLLSLDKTLKRNSPILEYVSETPKAKNSVVGALSEAKGQTTCAERAT
jgi:hypothetical protein